MDLNGRPCGSVRKSRRNPNAYTKDELVQLAVKNLGYTKTDASSMGKPDLCIALSSGQVKSRRFDLLPRVCTNRRSKEYPTRYSRKELEELAFERLRIPKGKSKKIKVKELCESLQIPYFHLEPKGKKKEKVPTPTLSELSEQPVDDSRKCIHQSKIPLKTHQKRVVNFISDPQHRGLIVIHSVGSGKTLTAVTATMCFLNENPRANVYVITPTSLMENFRKEMRAYGADPDNKRIKMYTIQGFTNASKKKKIKCEGNMFILDEAHNLRTSVKSGGANVKEALKCTQNAKKVLLLTATPLINSPSDIINLIAMVDGKDRPVSERSFYHAPEAYLDCKTSVYAPDADEMKEFYPRTKTHDVFLEMSPSYYEKYLNVEDQNMDENIADIYGNDAQLAFFFNGVRRASNNLESIYSPKINWIIEKIEKSKKNEKFVIFSNFIDAGIQLVMKRLKDIPYAYIDGSMNKNKRKEAVEAYNKNKLKILFISRAGGEGLDLKETRYIIVMEPNWNENLISQVIGRGVRFKSHYHLPAEKQKVDIYRLYMIKPSEKPNLAEIKNYLKEQLSKELKISTIVQNMTDRELLTEVLSIDLYLSLMAKNKQYRIDRFMELIKRYSIEEKDCSSVRSIRTYRTPSPAKQKKTSRKKSKRTSRKKSKKKSKKTSKKTLKKKSKTLKKKSKKTTKKTTKKTSKTTKKKTRVSKKKSSQK